MILAMLLTANLILYNGNIFTANPTLPKVQAIAIKGDRIIALGSNEEVLKFKGPGTQLIDLKGAFVTPGIVDAHLHFLSGSLTLVRLDLTGKSLEECLEAVKKRTEQLPPGVWIVGRGWDQSLWPGQKYPDRWMLDKVAPKNPVYLVRVDGHSVWVNSLALKLAGIDKNTPQPEGGEIVKNEKGEPMGILKEEAASLIHPPQPDKEQKVEALKKGFLYALKHGVTTVVDMSEEDTLYLYRELELKEELPIRVVFNGFMSYGLERNCRLRDKIKSWNSDHIFFGFVKGFVDGTFGSGTAALKEPYKDTGKRGILVVKPEEFFKDVIMYHRAGFQMAFHAIGDRAVEVALEAIKRAQQNFPREDPRHRIEHIQLISPEDYYSFVLFNVIPSVQPCHILADIRFVERRLGKERAKYSYPWASFLKRKLALAFGTDWPVESIDPRRNLYAAVKRVDWNVHERVSLEEALYSSTIRSAYSVFLENKIGSLEVGKYADLVVWEKSFFELTPEQYLKNDVIMTIVDGKILYRREK